MKRQPVNKIVMIVSMVTILILATSPAFADMLVNTQWLSSRADKSGIKIVDVQNKALSYHEGHIPGALQVDRHADLEDYTRYPPNKYPQKEQFLELMTRLGISNDDTIVAYDDHHGIFASRFLFIMELYGHDPAKLKILDGGIVQWRKDGLALSSEPVIAASTEPYRTTGPNNELLVTWNDVLRQSSKVNDTDVVLLDARPDQEFTGEKIRAIRGGHIPGAINFYGQAEINDNDSHLYKSLEQIRTTFIEAGVTEDKTIFGYCHSSDRAAHIYMVLTRMLGYKNVKIYDGAWKEWAALTALPAENESWQWDAR